MFDAGVIRGLFEAQLEHPAVVRDFAVYAYEHVDVLEFMPTAAEVLEGLEGADALLGTVMEVLTGAGWEGDGELRILWLPPFIVGTEDTWGEAIWFVKQSNNGTAFMASPVELPFEALLSQQ